MSVLQSTAAVLTPAPAGAPAGCGRATDGCHVVGGVTIRLIDATPRDRAMVTRQIGHSSLIRSSTPDLTLRFVDRVATPDAIRLLGDDIQVSGDAFLLQGAGAGRSHRGGSTGGSPRVQIPFDQLGQACEIVCERGLKSVPLLVEMIHVAALAKGVLPLHASAFVYRGATSLVVGCADGGKTGALLAFMAQGARFVSDDWCYWDLDQESLSGMPGLLRMRKVYLDQLPAYRSKVSRRDCRRMQWLRIAERMLDHLGDRPAGAAPAVRRLRSAVARRQCVYVQPQRLFGDALDAVAGAPARIFLLENHQSDDVVIERLAPPEAARRMAFVIDEELADLRAYYRKFRYAFPDTSNALLEDSAALQYQLIRRATASSESFLVCHRHPSSLAALFAAMSQRI